MLRQPVLIISTACSKYYNAHEPQSLLPWRGSQSEAPTRAVQNSKRFSVAGNKRRQPWLLNDFLSNNQIFSNTVADLLHWWFNGENFPSIQATEELKLWVTWHCLWKKLMGLLLPEPDNLVNGLTLFHNLRVAAICQEMQQCDSEKGRRIKSYVLWGRKCIQHHCYTSMIHNVFWWATLKRAPLTARLLDKSALKSESDAAMGNVRPEAWSLDAVILKNGNSAQQQQYHYNLDFLTQKVKRISVPWKWM